MAELLIHHDIETEEPVGIWWFGADGWPESHYVDEERAADGYEAIGGRGSDAQYFLTRFLEGEQQPWGWSKVDDALAPAAAVAPKAQLEQLRREWAGVSPTARASAFVAAVRRKRFLLRNAQRLAGQVLGEEAKPFEADRRVSATISVWSSADHERLVVVMGEGETFRDIDKALAYGLTFQGDRDLHLVLPDETRQFAGLGPLSVAHATLHRTAHLAAPVSVWHHAPGDEHDRYGRPLHDATPLIIPSRHQVKRATRLDESLQVGEHDLGERYDWIQPLRDLADELGLDASPRLSYLAWHADGRQVLKVQRAGGGVRVTAGTDYSAHRKGKTMATVFDLAGPIGADDVERIRAAVAGSIAEREAGDDAENLEHLLQSRLATTAGVAQLGLVGRVEREVPATRPNQRRAYIDLLGVDECGDIHVVETKIGLDAMLALQGLDYWVWATEHRDDLVALLRDRGHEVRDSAVIHLDFVVGTRDDFPPDFGYLAPQLEALDGGIPWRVGTVTGWRPIAGPGTDAGGDSLEISWEPRRSLPFAASHRPRFATRLHAHLLDHHRDRRGHGRSPMLTDPVASLRVDARPAWRQLDAARLLHRYAGHVRSSQQFALNLFGSLTHEGATMLLLPLLGYGWTVRRIDFEFVDHDDTLGEAQGNGTHRTQADVAITAVDERGGRHLVLVEVKLSEDDFGHCSGYEDPANDRIDGCAQPGAFGGAGQATCFKLVNHGKGGMRHYDRFVEVDDSVSPIAGCPFRRSINQPMRYAALAGALRRTGEWESVILALCAHDEHRSIWRRWEEAKQVIRGQRMIDLPASAVLAQITPADADVLAAQYDIPWDPDDVGRLRNASEGSQRIGERVFAGGGVIHGTEQALTSLEAARNPLMRALAQRLEFLAEMTRATRADVVPPVLFPLWDKGSGTPDDSER